MIKNENYITIQGFMINELNLKGNELLVYAIIYGFSQTEGQVFNGSLKYLASWTNSSIENIRKVLKSLVNKNLIAKKEVFINGVKFCEYHTTKLGGIQQSCIGYTTKLDRGIQQSCNNNIYNNTNNNIEYIYSEKQDLENLWLEIKDLENRGQYNTNNKITKNKNTKYIYIGEYRRVKLTEEQYQKLCNEFGKTFIDMQIKRLDEYVESNNNKNKYSNYNLVLRKAIRENWFKIQNKPEWFNHDQDINEATQEEIEELEQLLK